MKRLICIFLILAICLATVGCAAEEINDPGPPTQWHFDTTDEFFAMEEAMQMEDVELEVYAEEHGLWLVPGFDSIRSTAERISEMVHEVKIPQLDGYKTEFIIVNPELGRSDVFIRLQGAQTIHVLYSFEEKWNKKWIASLGRRGDKPIENPYMEMLYLTERDENIDGEQIYRFGAIVNGTYVRIFVFGGSLENAKESVSSMRFVDIEELRR